MTTTTNPLLDAADYIQEHGWCRNSYLDEQGQVCLAGAVGRVTGALLPLTTRETQRELRTYQKEYDFSPEEAEKEIPRFKWSKSHAKLRSYTDALTALATEIDASRVEGFQDTYTNPDTYSWVTDPDARQAQADSYMRNRVEGVVVERNDGMIAGTRRHRTTKPQAVALLKRAAKRI